jgi:predicted MFS family arabinose efflux permease
MLLVYGLVEAPLKGWTAGSTLIYFGLSLLLLIIFVINEHRVKHPIVPLSVFKIRNLTGADLIQVTVAAGLFSVFFFSTLYFQETLGYSPVKTGLSFLAVPVAIAITATNVPRVIKRVGYKRVLVFAPLVTGTGLFMLAHVPVSGGYAAHILPGLIVMGLGLGATFVSVLIAATSGVAPHLSGLASGLVNTAQQIGGSLGLAALTGIVTSATLRNLHHLGQPTAAKAAIASVHGIHVGFYVACSFSLIASLLAIFVIKQSKVSKSKESDSPAIAV